MAMKTSALEERLNGLTDDELKRMLDTGLKEYTEEALDSARLELERRGREVAPRKPAVPVSLEIPSSEATSMPARKGGLWGAFLLVAGAFFIYSLALFSSIAVVRSDRGIRSGHEPIGEILFSLVLAFVCIRAGIKRKRNWMPILGISLLVMAALVFLASANLAGRANSLMGRVTTPTASILFTGGILFLVLHFVRRARGR